MLNKLLILVFVTISTNLFAQQQAVTAPSAEPIYLTGSILPDANNKQAVEKIRQQLADEKVKQIHLVINSPGGRVDVGQYYLDLFKAAKHFNVNIKCTVDGIAMSMALIIFSACDTREVTAKSYLMWHSASFQTSGRFNEQAVKSIYEEFTKMNGEMWEATRRWFEPKYWQKHFDEETILTALDAYQNAKPGYFKLVRSVTK